MSPWIKRLLPWAISLTVLTLWSLSPSGWARPVLEGASLPQVTDPAKQGLADVFHTLERELNAAAATGRDGYPAANAADLPPGCDPAQVTPEASVTASGTQAGTAPVHPPATGALTADATPGQARFRLCGPTDPQTERTIEQLVAGRSFSATLTGLQGGCAELTITATGPASGSGRQSTNLTIGGDPGVAIRIVSESGSTRASIGPTS